MLSYDWILTKTVWRKSRYYLNMLYMNFNTSESQRARIFATCAAVFNEWPNFPQFSKLTRIARARYESHDPSLKLIVSRASFKARNSNAQINILYLPSDFPRIDMIAHDPIVATKDKVSMKSLSDHNSANGPKSAIESLPKSVHCAYILYTAIIKRKGEG